MILDGHFSRANLNALETAKEFSLHLLILPGRLTHLLQPLDKSLFKAFKQNYKEKIHKFLPNEVKKNKQTKLNVIKTATVIIKQVFIPEKIQNAFVDCGIELFAPEGTIKKILSNGNEKKKKKKKGKELTNEELKKLLAPTVVFQKIETKKGEKRFRYQIKWLQVKW